MNAMQQLWEEAHAQADIQAIATTMDTLIRSAFRRLPQEPTLEADVLAIDRITFPQPDKITNLAELPGMVDLNPAWLDAEYVHMVCETIDTAFPHDVAWEGHAREGEECFTQAIRYAVELELNARLNERPLYWFDIGICAECGGAGYWEVRPGFYGYFANSHRVCDC